MQAPHEIIAVATKKISCLGDKASAHPRVYLTMGPQGFVDCPYCGKRYMLEKGAGFADAH